MSDPVKRIDKTPESYSPKNPEIANVMKQAGMEAKEIPPQYMIDAVLPTGDNPWAGGSDYLRCFASQYMHLEGMPPSYDTRYWLYRKFLAVTGMGMVTAFTDKPDEHNYSFEAAHDYIGRLHRFAGYGHSVIEAAGQDKAELFKVISNSIYRGRPVLSAYSIGSYQNKTYRFNRKWRLFIGYDCDNMTLSANEDGTAAAIPDWFEKLDSVIIIAQTGLPKPDMRDVLIEIINDAERGESQGEKYGYAAYEDLIARLSDDAFFENADDMTLQQFNNGTSFNGGALGSFFWYHAESRGATGEGFGLLCGRSELKNGELDGTEYREEVNCNGFWGHNGHQISYIGNMAINKGAAALRDKSHREVLIYCLRHLMSNDARIIWMLKRAVGIDTPDVLSPKDKNGNPINYCFRSKDLFFWLEEESSANRIKSLNAEAVLSKCKPVKTLSVNFNNDVEAAGALEHNVSDNKMSVKTEDNLYKTTGMIQTKRTFSAPVRIDACIENKDTAFSLFFNSRNVDQNWWAGADGGCIKNSSWGRNPGHIEFWDIAVMYHIGIGFEFPAVQTDDIHISWILQRDFMAVIVNGELTHYVENFPYTHFDMPNSPVGFSAFDNQTVIVKSLNISELE